MYWSQFVSPGLVGNLQLIKVKRLARSVLMRRMMSWILWTLALIQMLPVVAGMDISHTFTFIFWTDQLNPFKILVWYWLAYSDKLGIFIENPISKHELWLISGLWVWKVYSHEQLTQQQQYVHSYFFFFLFRFRSSYVLIFSRVAFLIGAFDISVLSF